MSRFIVAARLLALLATISSASAALANDTLETALGGPYVTCTGAIAWSETGSDGSMHVEPMRLAVRDDEGADAIALFLSEEDFLADDLWSCVEGICTSTAAMSTSVTSNVIRLHHAADLGSGEVVYRADLVFMVVGADAERLEVEGATGQGAFICEKPLPAGLTKSLE